VIDFFNDFHDRIDFPSPSIPESMRFSIPGDAMAKAAALSAAKDLGDAKEVEELLQAGRQLSPVIMAWKVHQEFSSIETVSDPKGWTLPSGSDVHSSPWKITVYF